EFDEDDVLAIRTDIFTFDDTGNAENGMDMIADEVASQVQTDPDTGMAPAATADADAGISSREIDDLGDTAILSSGTIESDGETSSLNWLLVRNAGEVVFVQILGGDIAEGGNQATDIARSIVDANPSSEDVDFNPDGTSDRKS